MKKIKMLLIGCILMICMSTAFSQTVHRVCADGSMDYTTISAAIHAAENGDIIDIYGTITGDGVPTHGIIINKNLIIRGQGVEQTIVQASSQVADENINQHIFTITPGSTIILQDLTVRHGYVHGEDVNEKGAGIKNYGFLVVTNCKVHNNYTKIDGDIFEAGILNHGKGYTSFNKHSDQDMAKSILDAESISK